MESVTKKPNASGVAVHILRHESPGTDFISAQKLINEGKGIRFPTNHEADIALQEKPRTFDNKSMYWLGTGLIYEAPGEPFKRTVEFIYEKDQKTQTTLKVIVEIPTEYQGKRDSAIILHQPHWTMEQSGGNHVFKILEPKIHIIENFPNKEGWWHTDKGTGIPIGIVSSPNNSPDSRYLYRAKGAWVGPLARGGEYFGGCGDLAINANSGPNRRLGIAVIRT